ncbi:MAG TPA: MutS2/Smr-associated SH3 domain-containing protein [Phycisphaerae bacterium]|nr:MutS2/Smr-associated SH3 domain-containing protein [Phycisphaerae bacterium]
MDAHTLEKLDFQRVRELLAEQAACGLGRELAQRISPSRRADQVSIWLRQTEEFTKWVTTHGLPPFGGIRDVRPQVKKAVPPAKLEPAEFAELAETLVGIDAVRLYFQGCEQVFESIGKIAGRIGDFRVIAERIGRVIDNRGQVRDEASERLYRIRHEIEDVRQKTREVFEKLLRQSHITKFLQYASATFHDDRMVLPVKADQRGRVPGIVHRSSDTGQTLFVEPSEAVELNNTRINLLLQENEEIGRILWELTHLVHLNQKEILRTLEAVAVVDLLAAKVKLARRFQLNLPQLSPDRRLVLHHARNPILMAEFETHHGAGHNHPVVPIDVRLGDDFDIMMITGPNTGGKTATLKTVGLLVLMAQAGLPIPAGAGSTLPVFDGVWIDVGDEQSLVQSLSTFSAHLKRILDILQRARRSTLVLLDELGAGTDPEEGAAIGRAIVEHLLQSGSLAMITTHLGALKALGYETKRVDNASVEFDVQTLRPTYHLRIGEPGNSNALAIASRLGMPKRLVDAARRHLTGQYRALNKAISRTLDSRRDAERARRDADMARQDAARATLAAIDRAKALEAEHRNYAAWVERVMKLQPGDGVHVRSFDRPGRVVRVRLDKQQVAVDLGAMQVDVALSDLVLDGLAPPA